MNKLGDLLKSIYLFSSFSKDEINKISKIAKNHDYSSGQRIFYENDLAESFFVIEMGTIQLTKKTKDGDQEELTRLGSGAHFGELPLLDNAKRALTATAVERCEIFEIPYDELKKLLEEDPVIAKDFYREIAHFLASRLRQLTENLITVKSLKSHL